MNVHLELKNRREELTRKRTENALLERQAEDSENQMLSVAAKLLLGKEALAFLEELANSRRGSMKGRIETVITEAMRLIYDKSYRAEMEYTVKNNRSHLAVWMVRETQAGEIRRQIGGFGGGMADTMSVPLRLMVLMGAKQTDRVCVLDECWKHMDAGRIGAVGKFIRLLTDKLGIQVVFGTHHQELQEFADRNYMVSESGGKSSVQVFE